MAEYAAGKPNLREVGKMKKCLVRIASLVLLTNVVAVPSFGWGNGGHMVVASVAYQNLTPQVRDRVDALVKLNPKFATWLESLPANTPPEAQGELLFMIAATWADQIKRDPQHVADGTAGGDRPPDDGTAGKNSGYTDVAMHKYWHFIDEPFSQDGTPLQDPSVPNAETQIDVFRATLASDSLDELKSYDLVWLLHVIGDVHQPLHCASRFGHDLPDGDSGGNKVTVCDVISTAKAKASSKTKASTKASSQIKGSAEATASTKAGAKAKASTKSKSKPKCKGNLHAYWDDLFGTDPKPAPAKKIAKSLPAAPADLAGDLKTADWVKESFDDAAKDVYKKPPIGLGHGPFQITSAYRNAALSLAKERVALAGARLATILNQELK
jgi:hypothetical protein